MPVVGFDFPAAFLFVVYTRRHPRIKADLLPQVELVGHVIEIPFVFRLPRIKLFPVPFLQQLLGKGVAVGIAFRIEPRPGVAVPVPRAADPGGVFKGPRRKPHFPESVQGIKPRNPGADDQRVIPFRRPVPNRPARRGRPQCVRHSRSLHKHRIKPSRRPASTRRGPPSIQ